MRLNRARWPEVPARPLVLVPLGSTEQHGPHLPFATDTEVATRVARGIVKAVPDAVLAPAVPYGSSGEHQDFPGTVSIGREVLAAVVTELARSLRTWAGAVVLVNGHGGNVPVLAEVVPVLRDEGHHLAWLPCSPPGGDAHAGRTETSLLLHLAPDTVRLTAAEAGQTRPIAELMPELAEHGVRAVSPHGVLGDPAGATAGEGAALMQGMVADAIHRIRSGSPDRCGRLLLPGERG